MADKSGWVDYVKKSLRVSQTHADFLAKGEKRRCRICKCWFEMTNPMNTSLCKKPKCIEKNRKLINEKARKKRRANAEKKKTAR